MEPPRIVLVRGLARAAGHWHDFDRDLIEALGEARVERHDLPGNGEHWRARSPVDTAEMAADLRRRVWARDPRPAVLVAVSLGAMVCLDWCQRWPGDPLAGLVVINTSVGGMCRPWERLRVPALLAVLRAMALRDPVARERLVLELTSAQHGEDHELARRHAALHAEQPVTPANVLRQIAAAARFRSEALRARAPVLVLASARDRMVDPSCARKLAAALGAALALHADAGHDLPLDDPRWCAREIAAWLAAQSRSRGASISPPVFGPRPAIDSSRVRPPHPAARKS